MPKFETIKCNKLILNNINNPAIAQLQAITLLIFFKFYQPLIRLIVGSWGYLISACFCIADLMQMTQLNWVCLRPLTRGILAAPIHTPIQDFLVWKITTNAPQRFQFQSVRAKQKQ